MEKDYILVYDSGIGGLTTLKEIQRALPFANFLYFADDKNCPYGNKSSEEVFKITNENVNAFLKRYNIKIVVFACNTITACCIERFRALYDVVFVGTEPAVLSAMKKSKNKEILVICTRLTKKQDKYKKLVKRAQGKVHTIGLKELAKDVEVNLLMKNEFDYYEYLKIINKKLNKNKNIDSLVLGCTHYCYLKDYFNENLNINIVDGNFGVARRVKMLSGEEKPASRGETKILLSSLDKSRQKEYERILKSIN